MSRGGWFLAAWRWAPSLDWPGGARRRRPPGCRGSGPGPPAGERGEASFGMLRNLLASPPRIPGGTRTRRGERRGRDDLPPPAAHRTAHGAFSLLRLPGKGGRAAGDRSSQPDVSPSNPSCITVGEWPPGRQVAAARRTLGSGAWDQRLRRWRQGTHRRPSVREGRGSCRNCEDLPSAAFLVCGDASSAGRGQDSGGGGPLCVQCNYQDPEMGAWPRGQWNHAGTL